MMSKRVLSLGAGVQSTVLYLMGVDGKIRFDVAIFADTGDEPAYVYRHLDWLQSTAGPPILRRSVGERLSDQLLRGFQNNRKQRFVSIPAYTRGRQGESGMQRRQCTREFKSRVIARTIRMELFGCKTGRAIPKSAEVTQLIGFSLDETGRVHRAKRIRQPRGWSFEFPLIDLGMSRADCMKWLEGRVPHPVLRSACTFCPYRSDQELATLRDSDPDGFARAVEVDDALRNGNADVCTRGVVDAMYVHRSRTPLRDVDLDERLSLPLFGNDCFACCGT